MGVLRVLLALSVVLYHTHPIFGLKLIGGNLAVQSFFVISGFYMALILKNKYVGKNESFMLYITNRLLRIYPVYWLILLFTILALSLQIVDKNSINIFLFIQDTNNIWSHNPIGMLLSILEFLFRNITLLPTGDFSYTLLPKSGALLIGQAWSLQIELIFYFCAPFLIKKRPIHIILLMVLLVILNNIFIFPQTFIGNLISFIFLTQFVYFLIGILSYFAYEKIRHSDINKKLPNLILIILITMIFSYQFFFSTTLFGYPDIIFISFLAFGLPFTFHLTKDSLLDTYIGEFAYPIYLSHLLFTKVLKFFGVFSTNQTYFTLATILITLIASLLIVKFVEIPIEKYRQSRLKIKNPSSL